MDINESTLRVFFTAASISFNQGFKGVPSNWKKVAMLVQSASSQEDYGWLDDLPGIREWIGDRVINTLSASKYTIVNRKFEDTIAVKRDKLEDDSYGIYSPIAERMGELTAQFPDELTFELLSQGASKKGFDGQFFFDTDHVGYDENGQEVAAGNFTDGDQTPWYLLDCGQVLKPLVYQERQSFKFQSLTSPTDSHVFLKDEYLYGVRGRCNAGYGLWQLAYRSEALLNKANYLAARLSMMERRKLNGKRMGITPTHLVVPPRLEDAARALLSSELINGGETNSWARSAELIVSHHL